MTLLSLVVIGWLCVTVLCAWLLPRRLQPAGIAVCTAVFLAYFSWHSLLILGVTSLLVYYLVDREQVHGAAVVCLVGLISALFIWFKITSHATAGATGLQHLMPLGLSYYSFRQIHYIFEAYKRRLERHTLADFLCYLFFLPTIHVGPIHRFPEFLRDVRRRRWDAEQASLGIERVLYGYAKIVIIGNFLVAQRFDIWISRLDGTRPVLYAYLASLEYWMNLYFQFSGYSDVAIGFALLMGFRVMENFNYPFLAENVAEFWQRWHISLTSWCKEYVYLPMASLTRQPVVSVLAAMLILGLWHEFSGRYVIWGFYQAFGVVVWHLFQGMKKRLPAWEGKWWGMATRIASILVTLHFVIGSTVVSNFLYGKLRSIW